jgi:DNA polymerase-3 subunit beta
MRLSIERDLLYQGLQTVGRAVSPRNLVPVLSGICLEASAGQLRLRATDLEVTVHCAVPADVREEGSVVLPGRYLQELARRLPPGPVELSVDANTAAARIAWEESASLVHGFPAGQFPQAPPETAEPSLTIAAPDLRRLLRETGFATGHDESRPWFTGVFFVARGSQAVAMATDAAILAYSEAHVHNPADLSCSVILPGRALQELGRVLAGGEGADCIVTARQNQFQFQLGDVTLATRLLEGQYPDFRKLLPNAWPSALTLSLPRLTAACERAALMADQNALLLEASPGSLRLSARAPELGEVVERIPADLTGDPFRIPLNVRYLLEGLRSLSAETVTLEYAGPRQAVRFRSGPETGAYFAVLPLLSF